jgi:zinc transport system substrate-binding protein
VAAFVQRIGGDLVRVTAMVPAAEDPHTFEPKPGAMRDVAAADVYFSVDMGFEDVWLPRFGAANPRLKIVDLADTVQRLPMAAHHHHDAHEEHGDHHEPGEHHEPAAHHDHEHGEMDPHVWLSPRRVLTMAEAVCDTLSDLDPDHKAVYAANLNAFGNEVRALDKDLAEILGTTPALERPLSTASATQAGPEHEGAMPPHGPGHMGAAGHMPPPPGDRPPHADDDHHEPGREPGHGHEDHDHDLAAHHPGRAFLVFHPSWGYLAADYDLEQVPIEVQGKEPSAREMAAIVDLARKRSIHVVFAQPQRSRRAAEAVAASIDARVVLADPLAADWAENLRRVARELRAALR